MRQTMVREEFEKCGPVREVFVHTVKNFAFVTMMKYVHGSYPLYLCIMGFRFMDSSPYSH